MFTTVNYWPRRIRELQEEVKNLKKRIDQLERNTSPHRLAGYD